MPEMREIIVRALGNYGITGRFFYLSESGIDLGSNMRGRGISNEMHAVRLAVAARLGLPALQRTSAAGPMYRTSRRSMRQIIGPVAAYPEDSQGMVVTGEMAGPVDMERTDRALFVRLPNEAGSPDGSTNPKRTL